MAPPRSRPVAEDARSEAASSRARQQWAAHPNPAQSRSRKPVGAAAGPAAFSKDVTPVGQAVTHSISNVQEGTAGVGDPRSPRLSRSESLADDGSPKIMWPQFETDVLHAYRHAYRLNTPSAFRSSLNQTLLTNPGIGKYSPTMARRREQRRVNKDQLAMAVRKNFNGLAIQEGDVVVDFLYKVKWQGRRFPTRLLTQAPSLR
ncbi:MAG: hypothetical protein M1833_004952 [Piccolia ochrophora]|nr:MAG: hypothetical protein M1833_004952 [Piccolia ochrophora]